MSYAEHGSRVFLTSRSNDTPVLRYHDSIVPRKRSEGRLKLFDSCTDPRAWSPNSLDNIRYFREIVENPLPQGKIVPYDVMIETLIQLSTQDRTELLSLRRQLEKYKSLRLSVEQRKQLQDIEGSSLEAKKTISNLEALQEFKSTEEETPVPERPGTPEHSISSSSSNYESESSHRSRIDDESASNNRLEAKKTVASSKTDSIEYQDLLDEQNRLRADNIHQEIIIGKDSEIIALKNELGAKDVELEELKDCNRRLETKLEKKEAMLESSRGNLRIAEQQIALLNDQMNQEVEEWKRKFHNTKNLTDHLRSCLSDKSQECTARSAEIEKLCKQLDDYNIIKQERDCLLKTLNDVNAERKKLTELNREQSTYLADQEEEINRLLDLVKSKAAESEDREIKLERMIDDLRNEIQTRDNPSFVNDERVASWRQLEESPSFSEMSNLDIRKTRCALLADLKDLENEMQRRCAQNQHKHRFREDETCSKATCCDKELDEFSNEQLKTMQVPASRATNEEQPHSEIYKQVALQTSESFEKIQQLIVELDPYQQRQLAEEIYRLDRSDVKSRICLCRNKRDRDEKVIPLRKKTNGIIDSEENYGETSEGSEEKARLDAEELDEKIDAVLEIHVKRSIERVERISLSLEGAGDSLNREMARKEKELEAKNDEIAKLRVEVASQISRGQGDYAAKHEYSQELSRLKNELSTTQRLLVKKREQLESSDFKLKATSRKINDLENKNITLAMENEGLNKTVHHTNDLMIKVDEMERRLDCLQAENSQLRQRVSRADELNAEYHKKLLEFTESEMKVKEAFERTKSRLETLLHDRDTKIEELKEDGKAARREMEEEKIQVKKLTKQIRTLTSENKTLTFLENLLKEIQKLDKNTGSLRIKHETLNSRLEKQIRANDNIEEDLNSILRENERLQNGKKQLLEFIERNVNDSKMPQAVAEQVLKTLPNKVLDQIEALKTQLSSSELVDNAFQREMDELRAKSVEDASIIENLRRDIDSWNNKVVDQEKRIILLEEANVKLRMRMEEIQRESESVEQESLPGMLTEEIIAEAKQLKAEIAEKDERIEKLAREIGAAKKEYKVLSERVELLTNENVELTAKMTKEKITCDRKVTELHQQFNQRIRALRDEHNVSIKRLEAQYEENIKNNGNSFDPEIWLRSLTSKEMAELQKRISKSSNITRALNDKQNQQLQEDEKLLHYDTVNLTNRHYKEIPSSYAPYVYKRREFDKPRETPVKDNATVDDMQQMNFIHQCAMEHNQDSSN